MKKSRVVGEKLTPTQKETVNNNVCFLNYLNESITAITGGEVSE